MKIQSLLKDCNEKIKIAETIGHCYFDCCIAILGFGYQVGKDRNAD